ncbi:MAG: DUF438 domain-containing protein [Bacteroidetes bacterium]|jgi:uncharacterized protein|nr:DUF438 domain-containing protein [Bacteroidota bacterium]MBT4401173.1 DUF438 domain-containing protein [Bacteroidota bacterium]MBT4411192.1 DUF438 domain-containing protein [Bacteroidota bacterium]MBT5425231.1 DUF438 domain-containing protein [Bacteroidota bacterium]MBT7091711.1 DUF438 domain-containing protein [Bacteroidota bacterium]
MSEFIDNSKHRKIKLKGLILKLHEGDSPDEVRKELIDTLENIPYGEVVEVEQELIEEGLPQEEVLKLCDIHSAVLQGNVDLSAAADIPAGHPVDTFIRENKELMQVTGQIRNLIKAVENNTDADLSNYLPLLLEKFNLLLDVDKHYQRKEYLLFPYLEQKGITGPPQVMWGKHDEIRELIKGSIEILRTPEIEKEDLLTSAEIIMLPALTGVDEMVIKEEEILFPMSMDNLTDLDWYQIDSQTMEIGYCIYDPQDKWAPEGVDSEAINAVNSGSGINLPTGSFQANELVKVLNTLPVDMTFVDKNDKVKYFSQSADRVFTRSRAIINRDVRHCHPPSSVHIVEKILEDFKSGKETYAPFWIQMKGKFIHISYYALHDDQGDYMGTLEVSQDLTKYRALEGEQRIVSYE